MVESCLDVKKITFLPTIYTPFNPIQTKPNQFFKHLAILQTLYLQRPKDLQLKAWPTQLNFQL